jgi:hypothetical protein
MKAETDLRAGGFRCGGPKGCGWGSLVYLDVDTHIRVDHNSVDILTGNIYVVDNDVVDIL